MGLPELAHISDIHALSDSALLLLLARPKLLDLGLPVPRERPVGPWADDVLWDRMQRRHGSGGHSAFNALRAEIVSFADFCISQEAAT